MELTLTDQNFDQEINQAPKPVLVDFYSDWCPPCKILGPILERIEEEMRDKIILAKINIDMAPLTSQKLGIEQIPTVVLFNKGKQISGFIGLRPEQAIKEWLEKIISEL